MSIYAHQAVVSTTFSSILKAILKNVEGKEKAPKGIAIISLKERMHP